MDPMTAALILGATGMGIGSVGSILSGMQASKGGDSGDERLIFQRPDANPLQSGLTADSLFGLGLPFASTQFQASPVEQAIAEINEHPGLSTKQKRRAEAGLRQYLTTGQLPRGAAGKEAFRAATITGLGGFKTLTALRNEQQKFEERERVFQLEQANTLDQIRRDRFKAASTLAGSGTPEALQATMGQVREVRDRQLREQANRFGTSPVGAQTSAEEQLATLQQALGILSGQQSLATGALTGSPSAPLAASLIGSGRSALAGQNSALLGSAGVGLRQSENQAAGTAGATNALADPFAMLAMLSFRDRNQGQLDSGALAESLGVKNNPGIWI